MTEPGTVVPDPDAKSDYAPNVLGAFAVILSVVGVFFIWSFGVASLIGIGLGIASLVRSRRIRHQSGGVGILAIAVGVVGLIELLVVSLGHAVGS
ncbi:MAG TPA: hypothetical protein VGM70_03800 [Pseudolysinimonas sp.]|jgi:hypothetical protein